MGGGSINAQAAGYSADSGGTWTQQNWATAVLTDAGLPVTQNNINNIMRWMVAEEPANNWFDRNNPLNASLGTTASDGTASYTNLATGASYTAKMIQQSNMSGIYQALQSDGTPDAFSAAVVASPWASSHYGGDPNHIAGIPVPGLVPANGAAGTSSLVSSAGGGSGTPSGATAGGGQAGAPYSPSLIPGIPATPPDFPDFTLNPVNETARTVAWVSEFGGWAIFTLLVLLFGMVFLLLGFVVLIAILAGPAVGPIASTVGTKSPVGKAASFAGSAVQQSNQKKAASTAAADAADEDAHYTAVAARTPAGPTSRKAEDKAHQRGYEARIGAGKPVAIPRTSTNKKAKSGANRVTMIQGGDTTGGGKWEPF
jgi:hypothetical protein